MNCRDSGTVTSASKVCRVISEAISRVSPPNCLAMMYAFGAVGNAQ